MTIKNKIFISGTLFFLIFVMLALMSIRLHREVSFNLNARDKANQDLAGIQASIKWRNHVISLIADIVAQEHVPPLAKEHFQLPAGPHLLNHEILAKSGLRLVDLIALKEQASTETDRSFRQLRDKINRLYHQLDEKITTMLAIVQLDSVLGDNVSEKSTLAPYVLKSLNQLTLVALNALISKQFPDDAASIVIENQLFISSQIQLIDSDGSISGLFSELFTQIKSLELLIIESNTILSRFNKQISDAKHNFDQAARGTEFDTIVAKVTSQLSSANKKLKEASRFSLITTVLFLFIVPFLVIAVGISGLNTVILAPIGHLLNAMKGIKDGNFDVVVPIRAQDEIGKLAWAFNAMAAEIKTKVVEMSRLNQELHENEKELTRLRNFLSNIINSMPSMLVAVDRDGNITQWNNRTEQITGVSFEDAYAKPLGKVFPRLAREKDRIMTSIRERRVISTLKVSFNTGQERGFEDITIYPLVTASDIDGAVIRIDDVTDQVRLEEMMVQNEKMLSVGGLAAGMAHEINNPLAGIIQTANVMKSRLENLEIPANISVADEIGISVNQIRVFMQKRGILRMLCAINESGRRVSEIVDNMLSFSRKSNADFSSHHPAQLMDRILELAATDYDMKKHYDFKTIKIIKKYEDNLPMINCEGVKIQQVLLNILRNGAQAMHSQNMGSDYTPCFILRIAKEEKMLRIEIEDNGPGMDKITQSRIFEPFFTTKPIGIGTGLGLSVSYFIITQNHHGTMDVVSLLGKGSTFIIRLPLEQIER
ncbi:ATP-binding protein [Desulfobacter sp.]|uniref:ATP-binding protein n=1 Tax=Desulfobacter sp. TaxID=2294 RepID=UPI003D0B7A56